MNNAWFYPIHLIAFAVGVAILTNLAKRGASWRTKVTVGALLTAAMGVFVFSISEPPDLFSDFYKAYYPAGQAILSQNDETGLAATMRNGAGGFVNLPILAWLFAPFTLLPPVAAGYAFFLLGVVATLGAWYSLSRLTDLNLDRSLLLLFVFAASGPLHNSLREGNTTHFILLLLVLGLWAARNHRDFAAGLIFGFAALIKLPLLLLGIYFVCKGRWRVGLGGGLVCLSAALLSVFTLGWDLHVFWYEHSIKPFAETPMTAFNVQSIQGFFARLQYADRYLMNWDPHVVKPVVKLASSLTVGFLMLTVAIVIGLPQRWRHWSRQETNQSSIIELEVCIVMMLAMMMSTVSWSHYYLWMLLPGAFLIGCKPPALAERPMWLVGFAAWVMSLPPVIGIQFENPLIARIHGSFGVSHYLFAAALMLAVFLYADWRSAPSKPEALEK